MTNKKSRIHDLFLVGVNRRVHQSLQIESCYRKKNVYKVSLFPGLKIIASCIKKIVCCHKKNNIKTSKVLALTVTTNIFFTFVYTLVLVNKSYSNRHSVIP